MCGQFMVVSYYVFMERVEIIQILSQHQLPCIFVSLNAFKTISCNFYKNKYFDSMLCIFQRNVCIVRLRAGAVCKRT